jgi:Mn2+/Fe2+ NRAMP family transporter
LRFWRSVRLVDAFIVVFLAVLVVVFAVVLVVRGPR